MAGARSWFPPIGANFPVCPLVPAFRSAVVEWSGEAGAWLSRRCQVVELERVSRDPAWLDKAIRTVDRLVREANGNQKGKGSEEALAA